MAWYDSIKKWLSGHTFGVSDKVWDMIARHGFVALIGLAIVLLGGLQPMNVKTVRNAVLAFCVALFLASIARKTYTTKDFDNAQSVELFKGTCFLVGFVYLASWVESQTDGIP